MLIRRLNFKIQFNSFNINRNKKSFKNAIISNNSKHIKKKSFFILDKILIIIYLDLYLNINQLRTRFIKNPNHIN